MRSAAASAACCIAAIWPVTAAAAAAVRSAWISIPAIAGGISSRNCAVTSAKAAPSACVRAGQRARTAVALSDLALQRLRAGAQRVHRSVSRAFCCVAAVADMGDLLADLVDLAGDIAEQGPARLILGRQAAGQHLDLLPGKVEPLGKTLGGLGAGLLEGGPALLDHRQHGLALRFEAVRAWSTDSAARSIAPSTAPFICAAASFIRSAAAPAPLSIRAICAPSRCAEPPAASSASRLRAVSAASWLSSATGLLVRAEARLLHRLGGGARLLLGLGQIAHQHADIDPRGGGRLVERLRLAVELAGFAGELLGDPAEPVGRFVAEAHQPRQFLAQRRAILGELGGDDGEHGFERFALLAHRAHRGGEAPGFAPRAAAEDQPGQADQDQEAR